jgi:HTH-type transcriptional regulator, sugar sensing transcriptional regulator
MIITELEKAGLTENEAKVYLAALELGETTVIRLARKAGIKRPTTYLVVDSLKDKRLLNIVRKGKKTFFYAEDPRKISELLKERERAIHKIMPELLAFTNLIDRKPKIQYFEGKETYKEIFNDILKYPNSELLTSFSEKFFDYDNFFLDYFIPQRKEKKIWDRVLFPDNPGTRNIAASDQIYFRQSKLVPSEKFKMEIEIIIYGKNKIGLVSYDEEISAMIESQKIHNSLKSLFEVIWQTMP